MWRQDGKSQGWNHHLFSPSTKMEYVPTISNVAKLYMLIYLQVIGKKFECHLNKVNVVFGLSLKNSWYKNDTKMMQNREGNSVYDGLLKNWIYSTEIPPNCVVSNVASCF